MVQVETLTEPERATLMHDDLVTVHDLTNSRWTEMSI